MDRPNSNNTYSLNNLPPTRGGVNATEAVPNEAEEGEKAKLVLRRVATPLVQATAGFMTFLKKGNVVPLAIAFILSTTCNALLKSLIDDLVLPPVGVLLGNNVANIFFVIKPGASQNMSYATVDAAHADGAVTENVGRFLQNLINTMVIVMFVYLLVRVGQRIQEHYEKVKESVLQQKDGTEERDCPFCFKKIDTRASKCPFCVSNVVPLATITLPIASN